MTWNEPAPLRGRRDDSCNQGASAQQCARPSPRRQPPARGGTVTRQRVTCRHNLHPAGTLAQRSGSAGHQGASAQQCARPSPRQQPPARGGNGHAPARHLPSQSAPCRNAGAALRQRRTPGHLRSSAPGHRHGSNLLRGAGTVTRQRVTCRHALHPAGTLARRSGCAGHQGASAQQCARSSPRRQPPARGGIGHAPARHLPSRSAPCRNAGATLRLRRTPGGICAAVRPAITTAATSCAGRERSRASASPAVTICTLPERWRGAPAVPDTRGHLRSSAPGQHHGGNLLRGAGTVTRQRVTCRHDLHPAGTLARRSGCAGHQGASAQQCARPAPRRQPPARGGNGHAPARHLPSRSAPCRNAGAALRLCRTPGGICAAVRPAITTATTSCAGRERSRASASPAVTICTLPERWRGAPAVPDTRGHLRSSAPGQHHGGNLLRGAGTVTRQRVTCRHDLHPAGTLARRSGCAGHQGASAQQCARPSPRRQPPARGGNGHAPARHLPSRSAPCRNAGAALRLCRTPGGICAAVRPAITTAATSCAGRERSRASASPAVTICTLPERWRGAPAVPDTRGYLRSSAPGQHHGGNLLRGAGTGTRLRVTCRHDPPPPERRRGAPAVPATGASAQQCARLSLR